MAQIHGRPIPAGIEPAYGVCGSSKTLPVGEGIRSCASEDEGVRSAHGDSSRRGAIMKGVLLSILGAFVVSCSGCGGDGGEAAQSSANASQKAPSKQVIILMRGDSTNFGYNPQDYKEPPNQTPNNPAVLMQRDMDATFGAGRVTVINSARSGSTLENDINGWGDWPSLKAAIDEYKPNIVLTNSELNDRNTLSDGQYKSNLINWIQIVRSSGARPILQEPNPTCPNILTKRNDQSFVQDMNDVAQQMGVTVAWNWYSWFSTDNWWQEYLQGDCVHPTDAGYESKEVNYFKTLKPIVADLLSAS